MRHQSTKGNFIEAVPPLTRIFPCSKEILEYFTFGIGNRTSPIRRHYHPKYTFTTLALVSYLRSLVVRALHRHRKGVGSIPAGGPIVDEFFLDCSWLEFDMCMISIRN